jgi:hypothetical protein
MIALFCLFLTLLTSPFKSKSRLEAENAALRRQLLILRRKVRGRVRLKNGDCLHPATYMATTMVRQSGVTPISTVEEGAEAILNLAVADELDGRSGEFYNGLRPSKANPQAYDGRARERLRALSLQLTALT